MKKRAAMLLLSYGMAAGCTQASSAQPSDPPTSRAPLPAFTLPAAPATVATPSEPHPAAQPSPSPAAAAGEPAGRELCKLAFDGGTIFVLIDSVAGHNFSACDGGTPIPGDVDAMFASDPTVDRRCFNSDANTAKTQASLAIYSSTRAADLAAAKQFCSSVGSTAE